MRTLELFAGTQSFSKVARELGHETFCVDNDSQFNNDLTVDLSDPKIQFNVIEVLLYGKKIIWMSPPCTTFSMAAGNTHWNADRTPKTKEATLGKEMLEFCWRVAEWCIDNEAIFFIENPRARARWFLPKEWRKTVWYCQYGDSRAKPTDIWTNLKNWEPKTCKNFRKGEIKTCHHESAPRGSRTGTQGINGAKDRSVIPSALFHEIFEVIKQNSENS